MPDKNKRTCGDCTACCEGWLSNTHLEMYPGKACKNLENGLCTIYPDRPEDPCRRFECGWLQSEVLLEKDMRPDASGVILVTDKPWKEWALFRAIPVGKSIPEDSLDKLKQLSIRENKPLVYYTNIFDDFGKVKKSKPAIFGNQEFIKLFQDSPILMLTL